MGAVHTRDTPGILTQHCKVGVVWGEAMDSHRTILASGDHHTQVMVDTREEGGGGRGGFSATAIVCFVLGSEGLEER